MDYHIVTAGNQPATENDFPIHPAAAIFPMLSGDEFAALKEDIRQHGQLDDICLLDGKVLDGRNRLQACKELGLQVQYCELTECHDPIDYILSKNMRRRHLTQSQRAQCAADVARMRLGDNQHKKNEGGQICLPTDDAAKVFKVSPRSVKTARHVAEHGDQAVVDAVKSGDISVSRAEKLVDAVPDKKEQRRIVKEGKKAVVKATKAKDKATPPKAKPIQAAQPAACPPLRSAADDNAVAYIRSALADGSRSGKGLLAELLTPEKAIRSYINEIRSASEQNRRHALVKDAQGGGDDSRFPALISHGEQIIEATLAVLVWVGVVVQDGEDNHAAYRLGVQESSNEDATDVIDFLLNDSNVNICLLISRIVSEWRKNTTAAGMQILADHLRLLADSLDGHGQVDEPGPPAADAQVITATEPATVTATTCEPTPNTVTLCGETFEVQQVHGQSEFRGSPEAGWTVAEAAMAAAIEAALIEAQAAVEGPADA